ncbi:MAG TPA: hypothetical protein VFP65_24450 [Anaeromyxobacteraceae bacterium]|nr:hypothetical protein [Anaeromyxobacteraceae bacterium]
MPTESSDHASPRLARELNPEAGTHAVTSDPRELAAAHAANVRSLDAFPYYELRFGERGRRFGESDGAWLAALSREPSEHVASQVAWLGQVLSARGMPRRLLEIHLAFLAEELGRAAPERAPEHARLGEAASRLAAARAAHVDDAALAGLRAAFDAAAGDPWRGRLRGMGEILGSAVADERCGLARAVTSVLGWFHEPGRFPAELVAAVDATVDRARRLAGERGAPREPG